MPTEVRFHEKRGKNIPAASFKLKRNAGKEVECGIKSPNKDRWKGIGDA